MNTCIECGRAVRIVRNPFSRFQSAFMFADFDGNPHDCPARRACEGCGAEPGESCRWGCLSHVTDANGEPVEL